MTKKRRNLRILASIIAAGCVWATGMNSVWAADVNADKITADRITLTDGISFKEENGNYTFDFTIGEIRALRGVYDSTGKILGDDGVVVGLQKHGAGKAIVIDEEGQIKETGSFDTTNTTLFDLMNEYGNVGKFTGIDSQTGAWIVEKNQQGDGNRDGVGFNQGADGKFETIVANYVGTPNFETNNLAIENAIRLDTSNSDRFGEGAAQRNGLAEYNSTIFEANHDFFGVEHYTDTKNGITSATMKMDDNGTQYTGAVKFEYDVNDNGDKSNIVINAPDRQGIISGLKAGNVTSTSSDAINGAQLHKVINTPIIEAGSDGHTWKVANNLNGLGNGNYVTIQDTTLVATPRGGNAITQGGPLGTEFVLRFQDTAGNEVFGAFDIATPLTNMIDIAVTPIAQDINDLETKVSQGWNSTINGNIVKNIQMGENQDFSNGKNIVLTNENGSINIATVANVEFDNVNVTHKLTANEVDAVTVNADNVNVTHKLTSNVVEANTVNAGNVNVTHKLTSNVVEANTVNAGNVNVTHKLTANEVDAVTVNADNVNVTHTITSNVVDAQHVSTKTIDLNGTTIKFEDNRIKYDNEIVANLNDGMKYGADSGKVITKKLNEQLDIKGGDNISTVSDGSGSITVNLDKNLTGLESVTSDNVTVNNELKVGSKNITINDNGIDVKNTKIINVQAGEISANSTEAINGSQLWETNRNMDKLGGRLDKVGAGAAALAALHPMDFDPDDKLQFSAGVGNYKGETAAALGAFYRPTEKVMFSVAGTMGNGENMVNAGVTFALDRKNNVSNSRVAMAHEIQDLRDQVAALTALVSQIAGKGNPLLDTVMFPDVPENHWAYDYVEGLQKRGIIEGYPDGNFGGDRSMTRYEYAAMLYRALEKGFPVDGRLLKEFEAELGRIRIDRIKGADDDANKVERVRVNDYEDRDDYGSKLAQVVADAAPVVEEEPAA